VQTVGHSASAGATTEHSSDSPLRKRRQRLATTRTPAQPRTTRVRSGEQQWVRFCERWGADPRLSATHTESAQIAMVTTGQDRPFGQAIDSSKADVALGVSEAP